MWAQFTYHKIGLLLLILPARGYDWCGGYRLESFRFLLPIEIYNRDLLSSIDGTHHNALNTTEHRNISFPSS